MIRAASFTGLDEHLEAELHRLTLRLALLGRRSLVHSTDDGLTGLGLYIGRGEFDGLISGLLSDGAGAAAAPDPSDLKLTSRIEDMSIEMERRWRSRGGEISRIENVRRRFNLNEHEFDVLVCCLAPEIDRRYSRLFGYLQDDITKTRPTPALIQNLAPDELLIRNLLAPGSPLIRNALVHFTDGAEVPFPSRVFKVDELLADYLVSGDEGHCSPGLLLEACEGEFSPPPELFGANSHDSLRHLTARSAGSERTVVVFAGPPGAGQRDAASAVARASSRRLLVASGSEPLDVGDPEQVIRIAERQAVLKDAVLFWENADALFYGERAAAWRAAFAAAASSKRQPWILAGSKVWEVISTMPGCIPVLVAFPQPSFEKREWLWRHNLARAGIDVRADDIQALSATYRLDAGQVERSVRTALGLGVLRGAPPGIDELRLASRMHSNQALANHAQKLEPVYTWQDIVLPDDQMAQLREVCHQFMYRDLVYDQWSFGRKSTRGRGLNVLFSGPSGTGKTMAAEVIANEFGLDLYRIDLSLVVDKYIGETEKKLDRIFHEAESSNAILFFDEADALFGKRSEVRDSHDRYANIEIAYLLQKMEEYDGVVILATNLGRNLDDAFQRRLHFAIEFPLPDEPQRREIWRKAIPSAAPLDPGADLEALASKFKITGGNIKNIAVSAAFLAAADGRVVTMEHLLQATRREYQKMGRLIGPADFELEQASGAAP